MTHDFAKYEAFCAARSEFIQNTGRRVREMVSTRLASEIDADESLKIQRFGRLFEEKLFSLNEQSFTRGGSLDDVEDIAAKAKDLVTDLELARQTYGLTLNAASKTIITSNLKDLEKEANALLGIKSDISYV